MGVSRLVRASLVLPRMETPAAVSKLAELEWFHSYENNSEFSNSYYDDLVLRAQRLFQEIDEVIRSLGIPLEIGVMSTMFKGAPKETTDYIVDGLENFIGELEVRKNLLLEEPNSMLKQQSK
jgi:V/A-type H+-transporting ATPase subunit I